MSKLLSLLFLALIGSAVIAQTTPGNEPPQMADFMRQNGKIYVVVAVVVTILIGLFIYLISVDRKLSRLEKKENV